MLTQKYLDLFNRLSPLIPRERLFHDDLHTLAYGTDASFYRLIPKLVVRAENEHEVVAVLRECRLLGLPVTFRAAGTSLSGQAISDSVLLVLGSSWNGCVIGPDGLTIRLQPGVVGAAANAWLAPYRRKIGPDPASINSAKIGGIAANNASGMCCGTAQNSYRTLASMKIIFSDGTTLDTGDRVSREQFTGSHPEIIRRIAELAGRVRSNDALASRIRRKYTMKNTTGYSLNALVDFDDPIDIIQHLMIGSEGTLGFIAGITYNTVPDLPFKASSLMLFPDIEVASNAVALLKACPVDAVEVMDRASLRSVQNKQGMPPVLKTLGDHAASLLVETRSDDRPGLQQHIAQISGALERTPTLAPLVFTDVPTEFGRLWDIRKGLFPSVGAMRQTGTTVIIEDVAFPVPRLADATRDLQSLFRRHSYNDAIIFGHALEGNLHFVFNQDFNTPAEVRRYRGFLDDVTGLVVDKYDGSLKAEHGTGRNMSPFVGLEWGSEALEVMREIKTILDPQGLLNPGVILNDDREAHIKNLKPLPAADPIVDKCIECGFCEVQCPSRDLTLTPRQRIVTYREMTRLRADGKEPERLESLESSFAYAGDATCATDGLCAISCPVEIDTGKLIKSLRAREASPAALALAGTLARHMGAVTSAMRGGLEIVHFAHRLLGTRLMGATAEFLRRVSGNRIPLWNEFMPRGADRPAMPARVDPGRPTVVYYPSCINRSMGVAKADTEKRSLTHVVVSLLNKAGYNVVFPENMDSLCCGMAFASKGYKEAGDRKARELESALWIASAHGAYPVLVDMSPCLHRMRETFAPRLRLYEPVQFALEHLANRLTFHRHPITVAIHTTCSAEKMGLAASFRALAGMCAEKVIVPEGVGCCGWAGDRGFTYPELNASALKNLRSSIPPDCQGGYSTSRTCEIGLSVHSGVPYRSILYLVDECTTAPS